MTTKKIKDGLLVEYLSNGGVESKENYKNGKLDGKSVYWHENGQKHLEVYFKAGKKDGKELEWLENGQKVSECFYKNDKLEGKGTLWFENGQKSSEVLYKNGLQEGVCSFWHESGQLNRTTNYKDDKECGITTIWHANGQKRAQMDFKVDYVKTTQWFENGNISNTGSTSNEKKEDGGWSDKRIGEWKWWDENGALLEEANYKNFVLHGHRTLYNNKGQITLFNNYENGKLLDDKDNEFIEPYRDGEIIEVALFLLKALPSPSSKSIDDIFSDAASSLRALLSYLQSELWSKYCLHYVDKDSHEDLYKKAKNEVDAFIKILQYRLYENPKLEHTDLLHNISFTDEELGIDHHRSSHT